MTFRTGEPRGFAGRLDELKEGLVGAFRRLQEHDLPILAAGVAFRIFLSLFPSLAAAIAVWSLVADPIEISRQTDDLLAAVPAQVQSLIGDEVRELATGEGAGSALVIGVLIGLWAASSAANMLMKALTRINGATESRSFVKQRLTALGLVLVLFTGIAVLIGLIVFGPQLRRFFLPEAVLGGLARPLFSVGQFLAAVMVVVVVFALIYWIGPDRDNGARVRKLTSGAVVGVVGWLLLSLLFSVYTQLAGEVGATYSGLAGVVVTLLWLQLSMVVLLLGAELDAELDERARLRQDVADGAGQVPPSSAMLAGAGDGPAPLARSTPPTDDPDLETTLAPSTVLGAPDGGRTGGRTGADVAERASADGTSTPADQRRARRVAVTGGAVGGAVVTATAGLIAAVLRRRR